MKSLLKLIAAFGLLDAAEIRVDGSPDPFIGCEDNIKAKVKVNSKLTTTFFTKKELSYPWWIIRYDDGHLENTMGESVSAADRKKRELTSNCYSTHQGGSHRMEICEAQFDGEEMRLQIWGGQPGFFGGLDVKIHGTDFVCAFDANYPTPEGESSQFRIIKKQLHVKRPGPKVGERFYAWLSIEFQEGSPRKDGGIDWEQKTYKVEGYVKPVITKPEARK